MTNKKKKSTANSTKAKKDEKGTAQPTEPTQPSKPGILTMPQLTLLILLSMGVSKLFEVRSASLGSGCESVLGAEACAHASIQTLLRFKFHLGVGVALQFFAAGLNCWYNAQQLSELNSLTSVSPLIIGVAIMFGCSNVIPQGAAQKQALVALVLLAIAMPSSIPFFSNARETNSKKALTSLVLAGLMIISTLQTLACWSTALGLFPGVDDIQRLLPLDATYFPLDIPATQPILLFIGADTFLLTLVYAYAWNTFHEGYQRVRCFGLSVCCTTDASSLSCPS